MWPEQQHAGQQARPPAPVTVSAMRAPARASAVVPVADQQEREQAGQLPEEHQLHQVAGQHHAQHGAHEGQEERRRSAAPDPATCSSAHTATTSVPMPSTSRFLDHQTATCGRILQGRLKTPIWHCFS
jgi:hypothetical protein